MPETASIQNDDVIAFLKSQHTDIKRLFEETLDAEDAEAREKSFFELRRLMAVHETAEELVVHPLARRKLAFGEGIVDARLSEEKEAKEHLVALDKLDVKSADFHNTLSELKSAVLEHAEHEEKEEFDKLRAELSGDELERAASMVRIAERIAPTRAHPGVELASVNMVAGPFAAMVDRARDAFSGLA
jgi:Hemerythrin HHE cation binding domain